MTFPKFEKYVKDLNIDVDNPKITPIRIEKNVFGDYLNGHLSFIDDDYDIKYESFRNIILTSYEEHLETEIELEKWRNERDNIVFNLDFHNIEKEKKMAKMTSRIDEEIQFYKIKRVYTRTDYPLAREVFYRYDLYDNVTLTFGHILYIFTLTYIHMCKLEEEGKDPYGLWGCISDRLYNGYSEVIIGKDSEGVESLICNFGCDS
jgi:hypothetical protein